MGGTNNINDYYLIGDIDSNNTIITATGNDFLMGGTNNGGLYIIIGDVSGNIGVITKAGDDILIGGSGADWLFGDMNQNFASLITAGNDILMGGSGNDILVGDVNQNFGVIVNGGNNTLEGGKGDDQLTGGLVLGNPIENPGVNTFVFDVADNGDGHDTVYDFNTAIDILQFKNMPDAHFDGAIDSLDLHEISEVVDNNGHIQMNYNSGNSSIVFFNISMDVGTEITDYIPASNIIFA